MKLHNTDNYLMPSVFVVEIDLDQISQLAAEGGRIDQQRILGVDFDCPRIEIERADKAALTIGRGSFWMQRDKVAAHWRRVGQTAYDIAGLVV